MSTRWNFKNNAERYENYKELDTNPNHYKSKYDRPYTPKNNYESRDNYQVGVSMTYIDGSYFRTNSLTVDDITKALNDGKRWLGIASGGKINLGYVMHYEPYKFYDKPKERKPAPWKENRGPKFRTNINEHSF